MFNVRLYQYYRLEHQLFQYSNYGSYLLDHMLCDNWLLATVMYK